MAKEIEDKALTEIGKRKDVVLNEIINIPDYKVTANGQDISDEIPLPEFRPLVRFLKTIVNIPDSKRLF